MRFSTVFLSLLVAGIHSLPSSVVQRESVGITVGADGSTNVGGESGITKKPDGSSNVGGESGINVAGGANGQLQQAAGGAGSNKNETDGLNAFIGTVNGASGGNSTGGAKPSGTGAKPKGTGNANANLPPGVASNSSLSSVFGALEGAR